jgi:methionine-S-sulfoxide reductase
MMVLALFAFGFGGNDVFADLPQPKQELPVKEGQASRVAVFAGGCFWCVEAVFEQLPGVSDVVSGYAGGTPETANYTAVSGGDTDHAEVIQITYDPAKIGYGQLLRVFFGTHDPTTLNRQGPDAGRQYRSAIFYSDADEKRVAEGYIRQLTEAKAFSKPIVTTLEPLEKFHPAEKYHQDFVRFNPNHPYVRAWMPSKQEKLEKLRAAETPKAE